MFSCQQAAVAELSHTKGDSRFLHTGCSPVTRPPHHHRQLAKYLYLIQARSKDLSLPRIAGLKPRSPTLHVDSLPAETQGKLLEL